MLDGGSIIEFNNAFDDIWGLIFNHAYAQAEEKLKTLKAQEFCDTSIPYIAQILLLCEGVIFWGLHKDYEKSYRFLHPT